MKRFASVIFVVCGFCVFCDVSGAPYEGLGRVREIATVIRDTPYPNEAYELEPYDNPEHIDNVKEEREAFPSKIISGYDTLHQKGANLFNPKPVVDGLREEDKYGNEGDKFYFAGKLVTKGLETISNLLNKLVDSPVIVLDKVTKGLTNKLDEVGAKIVGLAR